MEEKTQERTITQSQENIYDHLVLIQGQCSSRFMTLSSQYKVNSKEKMYDPLVSIQGQFRKKRFITLLSQYEVDLK